jgi:hypothetical protein
VSLRCRRFAGVSATALFENASLSICCSDIFSSSQTLIQFSQLESDFNVIIDGYNHARFSLTVSARQALASHAWSGVTVGTVEVVA